MFRHYLSDGMAECLLLQIPRDPGELRAGEERIDAGLVVAQGPIVQIGRVMKVPGVARLVQLDIEHLFGDGAPVSILEHAGILHGVFQVEEDAGCRSRVPLIDEHCTAP